MSYGGATVRAMLEEMRIRGLGVIEDATLPLGPGLTVVTGETGAGKTLLVTGLHLLFGGRAESGLVRPGCGRASVEGRLATPPAAAVGRALQAGAQVDDDGALLMSRTLGVEGRSRAHVGGAAVPAAVLAELGTSLLAVHGQSDQLRLRQADEQRSALDRYGGPPVLELLERHRALYASWRRAVSELACRRDSASARRSEAAELTEALARISDVHPEPGEDTALAQEALRLEHADALHAAAATAGALLAGAIEGGAEENAASASESLTGARAALAAAAGHDRDLARLEARVAELGYLLDDVGGELTSYAAGVEADPIRLEAVQQRRAALSALVRAYGDREYGDRPYGDAAREAAPAGGVDRVLAFAEHATARLGELEDSDEALAELAERASESERELAGCAIELSAARAVAAARFSAAVSAELRGLAMPSAVVTAHLDRRTAPGPVLELDGRGVAVGADGVDEVTLLLEPHPGAPARPLSRGASGGELSRVMLAVEVVLAGAGGAPTLVFDEVDAGVGGRAAVEVGRRLARLAASHQVLVVTHLPQVAAFADTHLVVAKSDDGAVTSSGVRAVRGGDRVRELSRMLAGLEESSTAAAHAQELLATAASAKRAPPPESSGAGGSSPRPRRSRRSAGTAPPPVPAPPARVASG